MIIKIDYKGKLKGNNYNDFLTIIATLKKRNSKIVLKQTKDSAVLSANALFVFLKEYHAAPKLHKYLTIILQEKERGKMKTLIKALPFDDSALWAMERLILDRKSA